MINKKISELTAITQAALASNDLVVIADISAAETKKMTIAELDARYSGGGGGGAVDSVNGQTGVVVLTKSDVGLANVDNTSDVNKPISTATQTALNLKANQTSISNIDNTSDLNKPISTATQTALNLKANLSLVGAANGIAPLDSSSKVPLANLPPLGTAGALAFKGTWNDTDEFLENDVVIYQDIAYVALQDSLNQTPVKAGSVDWQPVYILPNTFLAGDGSPTAPSYAFSSDNGTDTGMYWISDGILGFATNGTASHQMSNAGLESTGVVKAAQGFNSPAYAASQFAFFDGTNDLVTSGLFGFDSGAGNFNGLRLNHTIFSDSITNDNKNLHLIQTQTNPDGVDSKQFWNHLFLDVGVGTDDLGFRVGDPTDVKSVLVLQDITYTSRRHGTDGDEISVEYIGGGTAGSEAVTNVSFAYTVQIEDGVSTADQIVAAIISQGNFGGQVDVVVTGTGSNPQVIAAATNLAGGENDDGGLGVFNANIYNRNKSDMGRVRGYQLYFDLGNGTDAVRANQFQGFTGGLTVHDNSKIYGVNVLDYNLNISTVGDSKIQGEYNGVFLNGQIGLVTQGIKGFSLSMNGTGAEYLTGFQNTMQFTGDIQHSAIAFADFGNYQGDIGDNYFGVAIQPNINTTDGFFGINISPNVTSSRFNSDGINVNMQNVNVYPGVKASLTIQDLFIESTQPGSYLNGLTVEYVSDTTAGSETASVAGLALTVHMEDGVSTATQIRTALLANINVAGNFNITVTGVGSNPQTIQAPTNLTGGQNAGSKKAAEFNGDVNIQGNLAFTGSLALGTLNAFHSQAVANGGGAPASIHTLISSPTVAASTTVAFGDTLGVNTAMLLTMGDNSHVTTGLLGLAAMGLPAVVSMGSGSTADVVAGGVFALSLDSGATGGTIDEVQLCSGLAIPNGSTTVNRLISYKFALPFGNVGTDIWGAYFAPDCFNWMKGSLKLGGTAGSTDRADSGLKLHVEGDSKLDGDLAITGQVGFFGVTPASQFTSGGAVTASGLYTAVEQQMLQEVYDALRGYGLLT